MASDSKWDLYTPTLHPKDLFFFYCLFLINHWIFRIRSWEIFILETLKLELFYIDGACQHSGFCCKQISIYKNGKKIDSLQDFSSLCQKEPTYSRFIPSTEGTHIQSFNCTKLQHDNWCSDHPGRPALCKNYPASNFISDLPLYSECGYAIRLKQVPKWIKHPRILKLIQETQMCHNQRHESSHV